MPGDFVRPHAGRIQVPIPIGLNVQSVAGAGIAQVRTPILMEPYAPLRLEVAGADYWRIDRIVLNVGAGRDLLPAPVYAPLLTDLRWLPEVVVSVDLAFYVENLSPCDRTFAAVLIAEVERQR